MDSLIKKAFGIMVKKSFYACYSNSFNLEKLLNWYTFIKL